TLPELVDVVPEARLNLAGYRLRNREPLEARALLEPLQPTSPLHYILRAVVALVGSSTSECDTIPGRQCMAASYFLAGHFEEVLVYLNSIKSFFVNDDTFNFNYAQAKVATGFYREAEECLLGIQDEAMRSCYTYLACLCRCHVMNKEAHLAWEICVKVRSRGVPSRHPRRGHAQLLHLPRLPVSLPRHEQGGSLSVGDLCEGTKPRSAFSASKTRPCAAAAANKNSGAADLREALALVRGPRAHPRAEQIVRPIAKWAQQNKINVKKAVPCVCSILTNGQKN
ncbi:putative tetratricopeptide repeat protein, partial [Operophtera brumata]